MAHTRLDEKEVEKGRKSISLIKKTKISLRDREQRVFIRKELKRVYIEKAKANADRLF